jgi:hypothetical protein
MVSLFILNVLYLLSGKKYYYEGVAPYSINLDTSTSYNLVPFMSYQINFYDFLSILLTSLEFNPTADKYLYIFNYKGELITAFSFRPDLDIKKITINGICDLSEDYGIEETFSSIINSCDRYVLDTNS